MKQSSTSCEGSKALGPYKFNSTFYKKSWNGLQHEFFYMVLEFLEAGSYLRYKQFFHISDSEKEKKLKLSQLQAYQLDK